MGPCSVLRVEADIRRGEILAEMTLDKGGGDTSTGTRTVPVQSAPSLADLDTTKRESADADPIT